MYSFLNTWLSDQKGGTVFSCFGIWHLLYIAVILGMISALTLLLIRRSKETQKRAIHISINLALGLYLADFFLMPFAYGEIDIEKLPFHACTAMCVMCFLSRHTSFLGKYKSQLALLGLISNLVYVIYPGGVGQYQIHPLSYRAIQTLLFHGVMSAYGIFTLTFENHGFSWKTCYRELITVSLMSLWALLGNTLYNGTSGDYSHFFNWFFVVRDPFYLIPQEIAPFVMPFLTPIAFFAVEMGVYAICIGGEKRT